MLLQKKQTWNAIYIYIYIYICIYIFFPGSFWVSTDLQFTRPFLDGSLKCSEAVDFPEIPQGARWDGQHVDVPHRSGCVQREAAGKTPCFKKNDIFFGKWSQETENYRKLPKTYYHLFFRKVGKWRKSFSSFSMLMGGISWVQCIWATTQDLQRS